MGNINVEVTGSNSILNTLQTYKTIVLKLNIHDVRNILPINILSNPNTKYVIKWDFDLDSQTIYIGENSIIEFDGGSVKNGTLVGNNTVLIYPQSMQDIIKEDAELTGTWKKPDIIPAIPTKVSAFENDVDYTKGSAGSVRPANVPVGYMFFDTNLNIPIYWNGTYWVNEDGINMTNVTMVIGTSAQRNAMAASLSEANEGLKFLDTDFGQYAVWNGGRWVGEDGFSLCPKSGETANRPQGTAAEVRNYLNWQYDRGFEYFDTTLGKSIYAKNISSSNGLVQWVEDDGAIAGVSRSGDTRPDTANIYVGFKFFDTELGFDIYWNGITWVDSNGFTADIHRGSSDNRPANLGSDDIGFEYYDTDLNKPIYYYRTDEVEGWRDAAGNGVN